MTDAGDNKCTCIVDCAGLHEIAATKSDNLKAVYFEYLSNGIIGVAAVTWKEFKELYEDEAAEIEQYIAKKISMKKSYLTGAARIADQLNSGLSRGCYDSQSDLYTASIASIEDYKILTTATQASFYKGTSCQVSELLEWAEEQALS